MTVTKPTTVDCPRCGGVGEVGTGQREYDTGCEITRECSVCSGHGWLTLDDLKIYNDYLRDQDDDDC